jgi:hypothetical protein
MRQVTIDIEYSPDENIYYGQVYDFHTGKYLFDTTESIDEIEAKRNARKECKN